MLHQQQHLLFCEGNDDLHVIVAIINRRIDPAPFRHNQRQTRIIRAAHATTGDDGNFGAALQGFAAALESQRPCRVGLVVDRDTPKHGRIAAIKRRLHSIRSLWNDPTDEEHLLSRLGHSDIIATASHGQRWGIWLMPDNRHDGTLETFIAGLGLRHSELQKHATTATADASNMKGAFREAEQAKATLHAYLAWIRPPGRPYGDAIRSNNIGAHSPEADAFTTWFRKLFLDP